MTAKNKQSFAAIFFTICFIICFMIIVPFQVRAEDNNLVESEAYNGVIEEDVFSYNLTNSTMIWNFHEGNFSFTFEDGTCEVDGDIIAFDILDGLFDETIEESEDFIFLSEWMNNYQVNQIIFSDKIKRIDTQLFSTWFFNNASQITFGNQIEYIGHDAFVNYAKIDTIILPASLQQVEENAFSNCENLIDITILSHDVILNGSGIGYYSSDKLDNVTIRGYQNSTAETYAIENGFTFIALDEQPTTTTITEATTTIATTTDEDSEETVTTTITTATVTEAEEKTTTAVDDSEDAETVTTTAKTVATTTTKKNSSSPKTGDTGAVGLLALGVVAIAAAFAIGMHED